MSHPTIGHRSNGRTPSGEIQRVTLQIGKRAVVERTLVRRAQHNTRRGAGFKSFLPARRAEAPSVSGLEPGKSVFRHRRRKIVSARSRKRQKFIRHDHAHRVASHIFGPGVAASVAEETCHRFRGTGLERSAEHIPGRPAAATEFPGLQRHWRFAALVSARHYTQAVRDRAADFPRPRHHTAQKKSGPRGPLFQVNRGGYANFRGR